jgi:hypothetical protein
MNPRGCSDARIRWLLEGDPAIRFQTLRDLADAGEKVLRRERSAIVSSGWGRRLLAKQDPQGTWGGGLYSPKWTSTTYTLLLLRDFNMAATPGIRRACGLLLDRGSFDDGGINFSKGFGRSETCVTGMVLGILSHFKIADDRLRRLAVHLLDEQMPDGGWNCLKYAGAVHSSFHTTILVLEGLLDYERRFRPAGGRVSEARGRGLEFLLAHRMFRSHRTGKVVDGRMIRFSFPPRWHYDVLRGLDYAQSSGALRDPRFEDAVRLVESKRTKDGVWRVQNRHAGRVFFDLESAGGKSRWNTLRSLRVLKWWRDGNLIKR